VSVVFLFLTFSFIDDLPLPKSENQMDFSFCEKREQGPEERGQDLQPFSKPVHAYQRQDCKV